MSKAKAIMVPIVRVGETHFGAEVPVQVPDILRVNQPGPIPKGHCRIRVVNKTGDDQIVWNSGSAEEILAAKAVFDELLRIGLMPYRIDDSRETPEVMPEFDPKAGELIFLAEKMVVGG